MDTLEEVILRIAIKNRTSDDCRTLSQLEEVYLLNSGWRTNIQTFASFALLPSIRCLHGSFVLGRTQFACPDSPAFIWPIHTYRK